MAAGDDCTGEPSRRRFFKELLGRGAKVAVEEAQRRLPRRRRPPGAIDDEAEFLAACDRCQRCVEACPHQAVHTLSVGAGVAALSPVMVPDARACPMCEGFPCAAACRTGALTVPTTSTSVLGQARLLTERCFVFKGPECGACAGLCPGDVGALVMRAGRPVLDEERCIGCGLCIAACPTLPTAIVLLPLEPSARCGP